VALVVGVDFSVLSQELALFEHRANRKIKRCQQVDGYPIDSHHRRQPQQEHAEQVEWMPNVSIEAFELERPVVRWFVRKQLCHTGKVHRTGLHDSP